MTARMNAFTAVLTCVGLLALSTYVQADSGSFEGHGESVYPLYNTQVEMVAETVYIYKITNIKWQAECTFWFHNTGDDCVVQMGFPDFPSGIDEGKRAWRYNHGSIKDFACSMDDTTVRYELKLGLRNPLDSTSPEYPRVYVWNASFKNNQVRKVYTSYTFKGDLDGYYQTIQYVLRTGALWKGAIGTGVIRVDIDSLDRTCIEKVRPEGYSYSGNSIVWKFTQLEPDEDISIQINRYRALKKPTDAPHPR